MRSDNTVEWHSNVREKKPERKLSDYSRATYIYVGLFSVNVSHDADAAGVTGFVAGNQRQSRCFLYAMYKQQLKPSFRIRTRYRDAQRLFFLLHETIRLQFFLLEDIRALKRRHLRENVIKMKIEDRGVKKYEKYARGNPSRNVRGNSSNCQE